MFQRLNENKDLIIVAIASFFIGFGAASFFGAAPNPGANAPADNGSALGVLPTVSLGEDDDNAMASARVEMLRVENQRAGSFVRVQHAELAEARWVVIRELDEKEVPGNILGAGWQPAGVQNNIEVKLLRATVGGEQYQVSLFADTNEDKKFDHTVDMSLDVSVTFATIASPDEF